MFWILKHTALTHSCSRNYCSSPNKDNKYLCVLMQMLYVTPGRQYEGSKNN